MNKKGLFEIIAVIVVLVVVIFALIYNFSYSITYSDTTITIKDKWVDVQDTKGKYLIGSMRGEVFTIEDSLINLRYDSSTLYNLIEIGQTCKIHTCGWRFPVFSDYRNILTAECYGPNE